MIKVESGYAPVNGINMYYEIHGDSKDIPLLLIHGGGSTIPSNWGTLLPMLSAHYQVIAMELQAHGRTSDRDSQESFKQDAADVIALLQHLHINKVNIVGFSDGACTTLEIVINYPEVVNKAVAISGNYKRDGMIPGFFDWLQNSTFNDMPGALKKAYLDVNNNELGLLNMFNKDRARRLGFTDRTDDEMRSIKTPVLVMLGDQDVITLEHAVEMNKIISGSKLAILPGTHGSFIGEALSKVSGSAMHEATVRIIREFLDGE
jgi:pimeloyl-ACP methyl ester carboxylesterase